MLLKRCKLPILELNDMSLSKSASVSTYPYRWMWVCRRTALGFVFLSNYFSNWATGGPCPYMGSRWNNWTFINHYLFPAYLVKTLCFQAAWRNTRNCSPGLWTVTRIATTIFWCLMTYILKDQETILLTASKVSATDSFPHFFSIFLQ